MGSNFRLSFGLNFLCPVNSEMPGLPQTGVSIPSEISLLMKKQNKPVKLNITERLLRGRVQG